MTYGPAPWQQASWDWRAAANFIGGGAGSGLIAVTVLSGAQGPWAAVLLLAGMALVGAGLLCVWMEIGRPLRALHVFFNARTSWMTREALVAPLLLGCGLAAALGYPALAPPAALAALAFAYCQGRILQAARGIPAWRDARMAMLIVSCALAEGAGLFWLLAGWAHGSAPLAALLAGLVVVRAVVWRGWRRGIAASAAPRALAALDPPGRWLWWAGSVTPLALIAIAASGSAGAGVATVSMASAGLLVAATGAWFKFVLITRGAFNQGFALTRLPVRGVPRAGGGRTT
jgi:phenylacetyl-CoA:acceptor oxidoreductase subunit 2